MLLVVGLISVVYAWTYNGFAHRPCGFLLVRLHKLLLHHKLDNGRSMKQFSVPFVFKRVESNDQRKPVLVAEIYIIYVPIFELHQSCVDHSVLCAGISGYLSSAVFCCIKMFYPRLSFKLDVTGHHGTWPRTSIQTHIFTLIHRIL